MILFILLFGIVIGSFLNVCINRLPKRQSIILPGSYCPLCETPLSWYDNIPIISYLILLGRCRYCNNRISLQYPLVEILNVFIYFILYYRFNNPLDFIFFSIVSSILLIISFIDFNHMLIPDILIILILIFWLIYIILNYLVYNLDLRLINSLISSIIPGLLFLFIMVVSKGGIGGGDVILISTLGLILNLELILLNIILSFILGSLVSIFLLLFKIKSRKDPIPFGPFIILSFFIVLFYGDNILNWYYLQFLS